MPTMVARFVLLCALLALALAHASSSSPLPPSSQHATERGEEILEATEHARLSAAVSGCGLCQRTGQCDRAFRGAPGQFCQTLVSGAPCCCPSDAQCVLTNMYNCRCKRTVAASSPNVRSVTHTTTSSDSPKVSTLVILLILVCCVCCCCGAAEKRKCRERDYYAPATTQYGTYPAQPPVAQPVYPSSYAYASAPPAYDDDSNERYQQSGNSSELAAGALGAVAGLGAGVFLGSAFSGDSSRHQTTTTYFGGDSGFDGDSGTFGGVSESTFEFSGDTGGGDDGGDFGGDS